MSRHNFLLVLAYDGTDFEGWQRLPGDARSIQGMVETTLSAILGETIEVTGAGRTDRGVHAEGQAASFHSRTELRPEAIMEKLNAAFPPDITCRSCREVDPRFHARFRAKGKVYRYRLHSGPGPDPVSKRFSHHIGALPNLETMQRAGSRLLGEHDFGFLSNEKEREDKVRRLDAVRIEESPAPMGRFIDLYFEGPGFLHNQVRMMAALLLAVGEGKIGEGKLDALLSRAERAPMPGALGPHGLCLVEVRYSASDMAYFAGSAGSAGSAGAARPAGSAGSGQSGYRAWSRTRRSSKPSSAT
ncbi:MAG: tRNA pseudouridine(38-40) synthase TruA [Rectinema sp.]